MTSIQQTIRWAVGSVLLASALGVGVLGMAGASSYSGGEDGYDSDSEYREDHDSDDDDSGARGKPVRSTALAAAVPIDAVYRDECGACHMAYPPRLLPSASWRAIMRGLGDHFGENAELPVDTAAHITAYLDRHASDRGDALKHDRLLRGVEGQTPLRITELPFFKDEHDELSRRMVEDNPKVKTFSRCATCHRDAESGRFDEDTVAIPGFARWDD